VREKGNYRIQTGSHGHRVNKNTKSTVLTFQKTSSHILYEATSTNKG